MHSKSYYCYKWIKYSLQPNDLPWANVSPCNHEEADTRIFVHAKHAVAGGSKVVMIKASDTDVLVIAISAWSALQQCGLQQLRIAHGQGRNLRWIPVHDICQSIRPERSKRILFSMPLRAAILSRPFVEKEKICMANMGFMFWCIWCFHQTQPVSIKSWVGRYQGAGEVCCHYV